MEQPILKLENICKSLGGIPVLDALDFQANRGEFLGIVGTNGSGKTVLANLLTGVKQPDRGVISLHGRPCRIASPVQARKLKIYAVNQAVALVDQLTVAENLYFDLERQSPGGLISWRRWYRSAQDLLDRLSIPLSAKAPVGSLNLSQKRLVELARLCAHAPEIAIFDDCFVSMSPQEQGLVGDILLRLKTDGMTILYFSHRVEPMFQHCDSVTFIRDSQVTGTLQKSDYSQQAALDAVSRDQGPPIYPKLPGQSGRTVLEVRHLSTARGLRDVSFTLKKGEILGVAGALASGKHELARALFGAEPLTGGTVTVNDECYTKSSPRASIQRHIGYLPEDTAAEGLVAEFSVEENIAVSRLMKRRFLYRDRSASHRAIADDYVRKLHIHCVSPRQEVRFLSAGNQQKVNIAKWMQANCSILILEEPFKGIDAANLVDLYNYICQLAAGGASILLISSSYEELAGLSDRILVLKDGAVETCLSGTQCSVKELIARTY